MGNNSSTINSFFTVDTLRSLAGLSTAIGLITQLIKPYTIFIPTRFTAQLVGFLILVCFDIKNKNWSNIPLSLINSFVAASVASNTYDILVP